MDCGGTQLDVCIPLLCVRSSESGFFLLHHKARQITAQEINSLTRSISKAAAVLRSWSFKLSSCCHMQDSIFEASGRYEVVLGNLIPNRTHKVSVVYNS